MMLFEKLENVLDEPLLQKLEALTDRKLENPKELTSAIFYVMLAGLIRRSNSDMSTGMMINQINKIYDSNKIGNYSEADFKNSDKLEEFVKFGDKTFSQIFPAFRSQLLSLIISYSGASKKQTTVLSSFVNGIIVKYLGDDLAKGMSKVDLMNYLKDHRDPLFEKAPQSLVEKMIPAFGMHDLRSMKMTYAKKVEEKEQREEAESQPTTDSSEKVKPVTSTAAYEPVSQAYEEETEGGSKTIFWVLGIVALLGILSFFIYQSKDELFGSETETTAIVEEPEEVLVDSTAMETAEQLTDSSDWSSIKSAIESSNSQTIIELKPLAFAKDSITLDANNAIIDSLYANFKSNPRFQIQIMGADVNDDRQIAIKRAFNLKGILQNKGVDQLKIDAIATNDKVDYLKMRVVSK